MRFEVGGLAIINANAASGLPDRVGEVVEIVSTTSSFNYDYFVSLDDGDIVPVKDKELNHLTMPELDLITYIKKGNKVLYTVMNEEAKIVKVDYLHGQAEVEFGEGAMTILPFESLRPLEEKEEEVMEINETETINEHTKEYWLDLFFGHYENEDGTFTVPRELLHNLIEKLI